MGTRSLTRVLSRWDNDEDWKVNARIYRHCDGYLDGHGRYLYDVLKEITVVNGISLGMDENIHWHGPGRLAAILVTRMQLDGHNPDLMTHDGSCGQEFQYDIYVQFSLSGGTVSLKVYDGPITAFGLGGEDCTNLIFEGDVKQYGMFLDIEAASNA